MKVVIADDEAPARRALARLVEKLGSVVVAEAETGLDVLAAVGEARPDVILLDIHMPDLDGVELATRFAHLPPIVFVTAHDEHAVRAFELGAVDYLLKPVTLERLAAALHRVAARDIRVATPRIVTRERGALRVFDATRIDRYRATDKYTVFVVEGTEHASEEALSLLEERLRPFGFLRVHRSELVRVAAIEALRTDAAEHTLLLADGQVVPVSRRLLASVKTAIGA
jgi:DNA-binding LytR/AlgR family response regulator